MKSSDIRQRIINILNDLLLDDPNAMTELINSRVQFNRKLAARDDVNVIQLPDGKFFGGPLSLINTLLSALNADPIAVTGIVRPDKTGHVLIQHFTPYTLADPDTEAVNETD